MEERHRAAIIADAAEADPGDGDTGDGTGDTGDGEDRERRELRSRCRVASYVGAALDGVPVQGAEAELSAAAGCPGAVLHYRPKRILSAIGKICWRR